MSTNVLGTDLVDCSRDPLTGFYRDGTCNCGADDPGVHAVCAVMTEAFLDFSLSQGNDLITAHPEYGFPGLQPGDHWCLCAPRWAEALDGGAAPLVVLEATHVRALDFCDLDDLRQHAFTR